MRLTSIEVEGFKNLTSRVALRELGPVHVIHGANNVGKSNLLEAVALVFRLLWKVGPNRVGRLFGDEPIAHNDEEFVSKTGLRAGDVFNLAHPSDIRVRIGWRCEANELRAMGVESPLDLSEVHVGLVMARDRFSSGVEWRLEEVTARGGEALTTGAERTLEVLLPFLTRTLVAAGREAGPAFELIQVDRTVLGDGGAGRSKEDRGLISSTLALQLYDARDSMDPELAGRWRLFRELMRDYRDLLGGEEVSVIYDRKTAVATLVVERGKQRIPAHLLGSGAQQVIGLLGQLLMTGARIVAIEEPELNLRVDLQLRLAQSFRDITSHEFGPSQILVTSHSSHFEQDHPFHLMEIGPDGPSARPLPPSEARRFVQESLDPLPGGVAPLSYLTSEHLLRLSPRLAEHIGLERGGGVALVAEDEPPSVRILSNDTWASWVGLGDDE